MIERLFADDVSRELRTAFAVPVPSPVLVEDVLDDHVATELIDGLASLDGWRAEYFIEEFLGGTRRVTAHEFRGATTLERFAAWQTLYLDDEPQRSLLAPLLQALASDEFLNHLRSLGPPGIAPPRFKLRRYGPGDFFSPHTDGGRGMGVLVYLTQPPWQEGDGGRFIYESADTTQKYAPRFNSALLFPYREDASHHVEPVSPSGSIRYTLGCDYA
jgi:2OG-Fe(II) oxygenase superfamily